ncbi:MAG: hypothetical protein MZV63_29630 [Marinilabiliales bacterium]|nr:hypothetical protein [Marinilabiliales bacterium]
MISTGRIRGWRNVATKEEIITVNSSKGLEEIAFSGIHVLSPEIFDNDAGRNIHNDITLSDAGRQESG